jgi:hypothetical protein
MWTIYSLSGINMNRRELLCALAAGGVMTAAGLWMPGQKLISIPSGKISEPFGKIRVFGANGNTVTFFERFPAGGRSYYSEVRGGVAEMAIPHDIFNRLKIEGLMDVSGYYQYGTDYELLPPINIQ